MKRLHDSRGEAGFTLVELLVSLVLTVEILIAALVIFDFNNRLTAIQTQVTDMQQSLRIGVDEMARYARMAGRGGIPPRQRATTPPGNPTGWHFLPTGIALSIQSSVGAGTTIGNDASTPPVLPATDVLTIRGIIDGPLWQVNLETGAAFAFNQNTGLGLVVVEARTPRNCAPQALTLLQQAIDAGRPEAILLVSPVSDSQYAVVELDPANSSISTVAGTSCPGNVLQARIAFKTPRLVSPGVYAAIGDNDLAYADLTPDRLPGGSPQLTTVLYVGLLEEHRYYVRDGGIDDLGQPIGTLTRARVYPNTQNPWGDSADAWSLEVADNIVDLQVALGIDANMDNQLTEAPADGDDVAFAADEWLFNNPTDDPTLATWNAGNPPVVALRISLLARTGRMDPNYRAPPITRIEDRGDTLGYGEAVEPADAAEALRRKFRRRLMTTEIELRNI